MNWDLDLKWVFLGLAVLGAIGVIAHLLTW